MASLLEHITPSSSAWTAWLTAAARVRVRTRSYVWLHGMHLAARDADHVITQRARGLRALTSQVASVNSGMALSSASGCHGALKL